MTYHPLKSVSHHNGINNCIILLAYVVLNFYTDLKKKKKKPRSPEKFNIQIDNIINEKKEIKYY